LRSNGYCGTHACAAVSMLFARDPQGLMARCVAVAMALVMTGCGAISNTSGTTDKLAFQEKFDARMADADKASKQGQTDRAIAHLDSAIQIDPASKQPWLKKAQLHFEARQYGSAISEAQEVLQRDIHDLTAQSILAVSGLRVSAQALEQLRKANQVNGSTRIEAESVAKVLHEALGEPILMSAPAPSAPSQGASQRPRAAAVRPRLPTSAVSGAAPAATAGATAATTNAVSTTSATKTSSASVPASSSRTNPFGALQ
jgi:hypothetical protein